MPLMPFTIPTHIPLILSGAKRQTTRAPRKNPLKLGDKLYFYYKPRQKKGCKNCITTDACNIPIPQRSTQELRNFPPCEHHNNFFWEAKVVGILHFDSSKSDYIAESHQRGWIVFHPDFKSNFIGEAQHEKYIPTVKWSYSLASLGNQPENFMTAWAKADGFSGLQEAHEYFMKATKNSQWMFQPWDVIIFELRI